MNYKLFCRIRGSEKWACISPATLKFDNLEDAEIVADRYRENDIRRGNGKSEFKMFAVNDLGYIVK